MIDLVELSKPRTRAQAELMANEITNEKPQFDFMREQGGRIGRARAWNLWRDKFVACATGQPWAFALRGIRVANLALRSAA